MFLQIISSILGILLIKNEKINTNQFQFDFGFLNEPPIYNSIININDLGLKNSFGSEI